MWPRPSISISFGRRPTGVRRYARRWRGMAWRFTRRSSRPPAATPRTRWSPGWRGCLLHMRDLSGSDKLILTQESMAQMIGARSQQRVAGSQQRCSRRMSSTTSRGHIEISNLDGLIKTFLRMLRNGQSPVQSAAASVHSLRGGVTAPTHAAYVPARGLRRIAIRIAGYFRIITVLPRRLRKIHSTGVNALFNAP